MWVKDFQKHEICNDKYMGPRFNAYIDGFNLYKGVLERNPQYKWLDLKKFCAFALPNIELGEIHYFTARVKQRFVGDQAPYRQHTYLRVLQDQGVQVHLGKFRKDEEWTRVLADRAHSLLEPALPSHFGLTEVAFGRSRREAFPDKPKTRVQRFEEKGSDVNLASYLLRDAYRKTVENQLVITGDSDLVTPIQFSVDSGITVHSLIPNPKQRVDALANAASNLRFVETELLNRCQLPGIYYLSKGGSVKKPPSWS